MLLSSQLEACRFNLVYPQQVPSKLIAAITLQEHVVQGSHSLSLGG